MAELAATAPVRSNDDATRSKKPRVKDPSAAFVPAPILYTVEQAAAYLGARVSAIRNLIADHELRVVVVGQRHLLPVAVLDAWVRKNSLLASDARVEEERLTAIRARRREKPSQREQKRGQNELGRVRKPL